MKIRCLSDVWSALRREDKDRIGWGIHWLSWKRSLGKNDVQVWWFGDLSILMTLKIMERSSGEDVIDLDQRPLMTPLATLMDLEPGEVLVQDFTLGVPLYRGEGRLVGWRSWVASVVLV